MNAAEEKQKRLKYRPFILASVMLAMFVGAIEATIVSTAMPAIAADLGGFQLYSWVFASYLLMSTVTVLIYGRLSDLFGRRPVMTFGMLLFLGGSILCGFAPNMEWLIAFRFIQGLGAGAVLPIATTIVGDIYSKEERAKIQGYLSSVWGISAVIGPVIGGLLVVTAGWQYVFWVNIPLGLLSLIGLWVFLKENVEKKKHHIDYKGTILLTAGLSILLYILVEGGGAVSWTSWIIFALLAGAAFFLTWFIHHELHTEDPMMSFSIWKNRSILIANIVSLATGVLLIGISSYLPAFVTGVMEQSARVAGFTLTAMSIGWPISAIIAGKMLIRIGYYRTSLIGGLFLVLGTISFVLMEPVHGPLWAAMSSFFVGVGMGFTSTSFIVSIQSAVAWNQRGAATAANIFMRNLGSTVGVALLGGILNNQLRSSFEESSIDEVQSFDVDSVNELLTAEGRNNLAPDVLDSLQQAMISGLNDVYSVVLAVAVLSLALILFLPRKDNEEL
ncbi:MDR family MFS transporter [Jeotgalibacillus soli]|uniref:EmrB/QacA subfamily drug resistance transporter n=1 Tax=Jeotgalibacillus soli TaxID=889306 RepID=A0A0C2RSH2_9BACL|nr:MDR family MFS transporter [Jeotgalibacillus soli]KIL44709.1 emrB/QacA subfamily drug resistance transporter [Jeotgalibacillus soli]